MRQIKKIVLVATVKDHGPGEHDYPRWQTNWTKLLSQLEGVSVTTACIRSANRSCVGNLTSVRNERAAGRLLNDLTSSFLIVGPVTTIAPCCGTTTSSVDVVSLLHI